MLGEQSWMADSTEPDVKSGEAIFKIDGKEFRFRFPDSSDFHNMVALLKATESSATKKVCGEITSNLNDLIERLPRG